MIFFKLPIDNAFHVLSIQKYKEELLNDLFKFDDSFERSLYKLYETYELFASALQDCRVLITEVDEYINDDRITVYYKHYNLLEIDEEEQETFVRRNFKKHFITDENKLFEFCKNLQKEAIEKFENKLYNITNKIEIYKNKYGK